MLRQQGATHVRVTILRPISVSMRKEIAYAANEATLALRAQLPMELVTAEFVRSEEDVDRTVERVLEKFRRYRQANVATPRERQERTIAHFLAKHHYTLMHILRGEHHSWRNIRFMMAWTNKAAQEKNVSAQHVLRQVVSRRVRTVLGMCRPSCARSPAAWVAVG